MALKGMTYEAGEANYSVEGFEALCRALEHIHLGWAFVAWTLRLPVICQMGQLLLDAVGGGPRHIRRDASPS